MNGIPITGKYNLLLFILFFIFDDNFIQEPSIDCDEMTTSLSGLVCFSKQQQ